MGSTTPSTTPSAVPDWKEAMRGTQSLISQLKKIQDKTASGLDMSAFDAVDATMENIRLSCVRVIFLDLKYANQVGAESTLWECHSRVNKEYQRVLDKPKGPSQAVERRKVEKAYHKFLRISVAFYRGYIQRLNACYEIPELQRLAKGLAAESTPADNRVSRVSDSLKRHIVESCHATLIRIGDLSRYKCQAKQRKGGYETPLAYYGLAQDLKPHSGFAANQMGLISKEEGNSLDMLYYFYRSLATKHPHENARRNLEETVRSSRRSKISGSAGAQDPFQGFIDRFIHLHGLFSRGQSSSNVEELENQLIKEVQENSERTEANHVLLKMALINVAAHEEACSRYTETSAESAFIFRRSTLRFNVQFLSALLATLETALVAPVADGNGANTNKPSVVQVLLPILRTYGMWLGAQKEEVFKSSQALRDAGPQMTQRLIRVFTLLLREIEEASEPSVCPYLLSEDLEMIGLRPFSKDRVPDRCRAYCLEDGSVKPHFQEGMAVFDIARETQARILDILRCATVFAEDSAVPFSFYHDDDQGLKFVSSQTVTQTGQDAPHPAPASQTDTLAEQSEVARPQQQQDRTESTIAAHPDVVVQASEAMAIPGEEEEISEHDQQMQQTVLDMLSPLLRASTPEAAHREESSYGMHSDTANDLLASLNFDLRNPSEKRSPEHYPSPWTWPDQPAVLSSRQHSTSSARADQPQSLSNRSPGEAVFGRDWSLDPFASSHGRSPNTDGFPAMYSAGDFRAANAHAEHQSDPLRTLSDDRSPAMSSYRSASNQFNVYAKGNVPNLAADSRISQNIQPQPVFASQISAFSHPSSLYQGTPMNRTVSESRCARAQGNMVQDCQENNETAPRQPNVPRTASEYDPAVLSAALQGRQQARHQGYH